MGLAERFKNKLIEKDIFEINTVTSPINPQRQTDVTSGQTQEENVEIVEPTENILSSEEKAEPVKYEFEDVETQVIDKIRKTPYWGEFSIQRQEKMISSYLDKKRLAGKEITPFQLQELVKNIIILSNH
jgi:hypothetical protein